MSGGGRAFKEVVELKATCMHLLENIKQYPKQKYLQLGLVGLSKYPFDLNGFLNLNNLNSNSLEYRAPWD